MALSETEIDTLFKRLAAANPEPKTELTAPNAFCLLVAIVLSAQATDSGVNKATPALFDAADTPAKMAALGEDGIRERIKTIGLFNSKARNIHRLSQQLVEQYGGEIPTDREALQQLPGVGRKTANVWLNCVCGEPTMAVDTHVQRVTNRIGLAHTRNPLQTERALETAIPRKWLRHAHHWLILHGRYICKARKPECWRCVIADICRYEAKQV